MNFYPFNIIEINWQPEFFVSSDVFSLTSNVEFQKHKNVIYQIYGFSPIYGNDSLLYIGLSKNAEQRINQHLDSLLNRGLDIKVRIGNIHGLNDMLELLDISESILVNLHKPCLNKDYLHNIYCKALLDYYMILNKGNKGALMLECSNIWWKEEIEKNKRSAPNNGS